MNKRTFWLMILCSVLFVSAAVALSAAEITPPDEFFGFQLGADRKMARWDAIVEYYELLARESDEVVVTDMGPTTNNHPFLLVVVSSPENLARLERLREVNNTLFDAQGLDETQVDALVADRETCSYAVLRHPGEGLLASSATFTLEPMGIAVPLDQPNLASLIQSYLTALSEQGAIEKATSFWFEDPAWVVNLR